MLTTIVLTIFSFFNGDELSKDANEGRSSALALSMVLMIETFIEFGYLLVKVFKKEKA